MKVSHATRWGLRGYEEHSEGNEIRHSTKLNACFTSKPTKLRYYEGRLFVVE